MEEMMEVVKFNLERSEISKETDFEIATKVLHFFAPENCSVEIQEDTYEVESEDQGKFVTNLSTVHFFNSILQLIKETRRLAA